LFAFHSVQAAPSQGITINNGSTRATIPGPQDWFTGKVWLDPLFIKAESPQRTTGAYVSFEPGARTIWHSHPVGQTLIVTSGSGWIQEWGKQKQTIRAGDVVNIKAGVKHWHGATDKTAMVHLAVQENDADGISTTWLEKVTDDQFLQ